MEQFSSQNLKRELEVDIVHSAKIRRVFYHDTNIYLWLVRKKLHPMNMDSIFGALVVLYVLSVDKYQVCSVGQLLNNCNRPTRGHHIGGK